MPDPADPPLPTVTAVIPTIGRREALGRVLDQLDGLELDEVLVIDNGGDGSAERATAGRRGVRVIGMGGNRGIAARNRGGAEARGELLLMLDDDSYPSPQALGILRAAMASDPRLAVAGGRVRDVDLAGRPVPDEQAGSFDWFLGGATAAHRRDGSPAFFFPAGASLIRRSAFEEVGGFFEPFFHTVLELELSTRLIAAGWDVRYFPRAEFTHLKEHAGRLTHASALRRRVRNHVWYFAMHFPFGRALVRIPFYLLFDLVECLYRRAPAAWAEGLWDAVRGRGVALSRRTPLAAPIIRRAEQRRGRMHVMLLAQTLRRLLMRSLRRPKPLT